MCRSGQVPGLTTRGYPQQNDGRGEAEAGSQGCGSRCNHLVAGRAVSLDLVTQTKQRVASAVVPDGARRRARCEEPLGTHRLELRPDDAGRECGRQGQDAHEGGHFKQESRHECRRQSGARLWCRRRRAMNSSLTRQREVTRIMRVPILARELSEQRRSPMCSTHRTAQPCMLPRILLS